MKKLLPALLLGLAGRPAQATTLPGTPTVPAALDAVGLHLTLDAEARQLVQAKVNSLCRHPASLEARIALAEAAFPLIDQVLAEEGIPSDFRYLVLQESALQGNAESNHGAVGYWQLKRETALSLGLTVDGHVDERRHLVASTRAAARYLSRNNASLHNWANALLSYNLGLGGVRAATRPTDADADQMALTARSSAYILDFIAQKIVFEPACTQQAVPFVPWHEVVATPGQSLAQQAATLATDPASLAQLNPWLLATTIPQDGRTYTLVVPFAAAPLAASPPPASPPPHPTKTQSQASYDAELAAINNLPTEVPGPPIASLSAARATVAAPPVAPVRPVVAPVVVHPVAAPPHEAALTNPYLVAPHETLYALARRVGVRPAELAAWNNLAPDAPLRAGQMLHLSAPAQAPLPAGASAAYVVAAGDTFFSISRRYNCSVAELLAHNGKGNTALRVGETLRVPGGQL